MTYRLRRLALAPAWALWISLSVVACSAPSPLPDFRYFTLPLPAEVPRSARPLDLPLVLEPLRASGIRGERPILYSSQADRAKLLQYHYQLWSEPPTSMVQDQLLRMLEQAQVSSLVTDRLSPREAAVRLTGELLRFERQRDGEVWAAAVELRLRAQTDGHVRPLFERRFSARVVASDALLESTVRAFGSALDQVGAELLQALRELPPIARPPE